MGKPLREAVAEIRKCATTARHYATEGEAYLRPQPAKTEARLSHVQYEPLGPILAVMPWNFPFWQALRFFIPSVLAGNTAILKHAENVQGCAAAVEEVVYAGPGETLLLNVLSTAPTSGAHRRPAIRGVTLTAARAPESRRAAAGKQQEGGPGPRRLRSLHRPGGRRFRQNAARRHHLALRQRWPELHRGEGFSWRRRSPAALSRRSRLARP
jgi:acyl-CoA reductase-like NAD-dependent aldehyde dehydrogenase